MAEDPNTQSIGTSRAKCPICRDATVTRWRPFCSKRCADIDLGRWMTGQYAVPIEEEEPAEFGET
ncbi:MAG: DNA gyrase inhibitor YacG [Pseudomonadota bacterium]